MSSRQGSTSTFQHSGLKNATEQSNSSQSVTATRKYDAFGNVASSSGTWQGPFGYAGSFGYQEDPNGLKLLGRRYYDPGTGRLLTSDPMGHGRNWYAYAGNNPINRADPTGLKELVVIIVGNGLDDDEHNEQTIDPAMKRIAEQYRDRLKGMGYDVELLYAPDDAELDSAIERADGMVFVGHGNMKDGYVRVRGSADKKTGKTRVKLNPARVKRIRGSRKFRFLILEACWQGTKQNRRGWLEVTNGVAAYEENDHLPKRSRGEWHPPAWFGSPTRGVVLP